MGRVDVLLGLQWGDEGKGKIVDVLTPRYDMVARFQGGPNAGHTLEFAGEKYVLRSVPSGIFQGDKINIIGNGVVLDPVLFREEVESLLSSGHPLKDRLVISRKAHLILPTHRLLDAAGEKALGAQKVGTTGKGIGPTYTDKVSRHGVRVGDIEGDFATSYKRAKERHLGMLQGMGVEVPDLTQAEADFFAAVEYLRQFRFVDSEFVINNTLKSGKNILAEGAQGSMLDIDFGSYPFVTSSNTICAGSCVGMGVSPRAIGDVYGIFKAYCTRVGAGPFPTELFDEDGRQMAERGREFGAVTGRPRRCGWIDLVALRYTIMLNGVTKLIMMKSDVLDTFATIKACRAYRINGVETRDFPYSIEQDIEPIYDEVPGWQCDLTAFDREEQLPKAFLDYVAYLERELEVPIAILSVGPDRKQTIVRG
ncbi:adenylosuccinate synthase [uncultured Porphyromonas sp.]|jgi:adenylosuccinate synthase|uniref:adenylosuccinate synthase n=1 Tax=uncultured Porphyromonas sp. TaxID=159274 RepID=UPI00262E7BB7|nr:adenylosuccinate synthase [uncultured Porphyromonas sp.]